MSAQSIQNKINRAYTKAGKKLGFDYNVYRPINNIHILDASNYIDTVNFSVSLNTEFSNTIKEQLPIWTVYSDYDILQEGDFIDNQQRTFLIISKKEMLPILALEVPDRVDIKQVSYSNSGNGFEPGNSTYLARGLPAFITYSNTTVSMNGIDAVAGIRKIIVYTHVPSSINLMNETALDYNGFNGNIIGYDFPFLGAGIKLQVQESGVV